MILDDCCPYCGSEDIFFKDSRLDYTCDCLKGEEIRYE